MEEHSGERGLTQEELAATQEALRVSERRYRTAFETSLDAIVISRMDDGMIVDVNQQFFSILGYEREELVGQVSAQSCVWMDCQGEAHQSEFLDVTGRSSRELQLWVNPEDRERLMQTLSQEASCRDFEAPLRKKDGATVHALISASTIELEGVECVLLALRDITAAKAAAEQIRALSYYDGLTCLPNRRRLLEHLRTWQDAPWERRKSALLSISLDRFRAINDSFGSAMGDLLLQESAQRIAACVRDGDTVARSGGDEFSVILEHLGDSAEEAAAQAQGIAQRVLAAIGEPHALGGRLCRCTASIGITIFGGPGPGAEELLQQSDIAAEHARLAGRNTMRFFAPTLQAAINERLAMEEDLRTGIENGQLLLCYQPQLHRGRLAGAEALVRWRHPQHGLLLPEKFIPLAEETGLIVPLGDWVLEEACRQVAAWSQSREMPEISVAVNISARQFRQPEFTSRVLDTIRRTAVDPRKMELELTESSLVEDVDRVVARMAELRAHGLRFSVDDFGVGYSSLSYLRRLPLDKLKIDMSFVRDILVDPGSSAIARAIISLSEALGLNVVAEGVESEQQREYLSFLGCHAYQGFLCSEPLPAAQFEKLMADLRTGKPCGTSLIREAVDPKR